MRKSEYDVEYSIHGSSFCYHWWLPVRVKRGDFKAASDSQTIGASLFILRLLSPLADAHQSGPFPWPLYMRDSSCNWTETSTNMQGSGSHTLLFAQHLRCNNGQFSSSHLIGGAKADVQFILCTKSCTMVVPIFSPSYPDK